MMTYTRSRGFELKLAIIPLVVALTLAQGCANLSAIREFADVSTESAQYTRLVTDYVGSPARQKRYQPASQHELLDRIATERAAQGERLLLRHRLIEEYMDALGRLAADETVTYDKKLDALGNAVKGNRFADAKEADAFAAIAKILTKGVADHWRQKQLKELITVSNEPFQVVVDSLRVVVENGFGGDLPNERAAIEKYCGTLIMQSSDKAGIAALREWCDLRLSVIGVRAKAIEAYTQILRKIAEGHQRLYDGRNDLSKELLLRDMNHYSKDLQKLFNTIRTL